MVSVHSASCSTSGVVVFSSSMALSAVAVYYSFALSFLLFSDIALTAHPVTSWLVRMLPASPSGSARPHTKTLWSDGVISSSSMTHMSNAQMSKVLNIRSMIEVIFLPGGLVIFPGLLFNIRSYVSTNLLPCCVSLFFAVYVPVQAVGIEVP